MLQNHKISQRSSLTSVRSQLVYCSPVWRPYLIKDILQLERIQRRATKFILMCSDSDYKSRPISANLLPLMYTFELNDMFCIKSLQSSCPSFNIHDHIAFCSRPTRSGSFQKLSHKFSHSHFTSHFFFNRLPRLWNSLQMSSI